MPERPASNHDIVPPRLLPEVPLPPYGYVPGRFPHPAREPAGHSYGVVPHPAAAPVADQWRVCREYLHAIDLWNHGYYWEAHEAWEGLWHAAGRRGLLADFFKGLIKLAAAGVKVREGRPAGGARHARRAAELFSITIDRLREAAPDTARLMGLDVADLQQRASRFAAAQDQLALEMPMPSRKELPPIERVFDFYLVPS